MILSVKLKNSILKENRNGNYEFHLKNVSTNGRKEGCTGFIVNKTNNVIVYVSTDTEFFPWLTYMYRHVSDLNDTRGFNIWTKKKSLDCLTKEIVGALEKNKEEIEYYEQN